VVPLTAGSVSAKAFKTPKDIQVILGLKQPPSYFDFAHRQESQKTRFSSQPERPKSQVAARRTRRWRQRITEAKSLRL